MFRPGVTHPLIPTYHLIWPDVDLEDIHFANDHASHGNFRHWANITSHLQDALQENPGLSINRDLIRWAFSHFDSTIGDVP